MMCDKFQIRSFQRIVRGRSCPRYNVFFAIFGDINSIYKERVFLWKIKSGIFK